MEVSYPTSLYGKLVAKYAVDSDATFAERDYSSLAIPGGSCRSMEDGAAGTAQIMLQLFLFIVDAGDKTVTTA